MRVCDRNFLNRSESQEALYQERSKGVTGPGQGRPVE